MTTSYFRLEAPYPALASTMLLPQPQMGNNIALQASVNVIKMEDGSRRTTIKRGGGNKKHQWNFTLAFDKMEEFQDFIRRYRGATMRATWRGRVIIGKCTLSPVEFRGEGRGGERYETTLEMVEV